MRALICHKFQDYAKQKVETVDPQPIKDGHVRIACLLYTSPSPRDGLLSRMPSSA